jgi:hypothetical protein
MKYFQKSTNPSNTYFQKSKGGNTYFHKKEDKRRYRHSNSETTQQEDKVKPSPLERRHNPF